MVAAPVFGVDAASDAPLPQFGQQTLFVVGRARIVPKIVQFVRVRHEIEKLAVGFVEEMNQFVRSVSNHGHEFAARQHRVFDLFAIDKWATLEIIGRREGG